MRLDDGVAHGKADAHVFLHIKVVVRHAGKPAVKNRREPLLRDADAVVADGKAGVRPLAREADADLRDVSAVDGGVFQQIHNDLTDERRVHRHHQHLVRYLDRNLDRGEALGELADRDADDLLGRLAVLLDLCLSAAHARNGQEIFDHADEPLRVLVHILQKAALLLGRKRILVFEDRGGVADDARERRADVVRHRAQEIRAHGFLLRLDAQPLLLFDLRVHRADHHGHRQHCKEGKRVAGDREVEFPVGICKHIVDEQHAGNSAEYPPEIALRPARDGRDRQHEDEVHVAAAVVDPSQQRAEHRRRSQDRRRQQKVVDPTHFFGDFCHVAAFSRLIVGAEKDSACFPSPL